MRNTCEIFPFVLSYEYFRKDSIFKKVLSRKVSHFGVSDFETVIRHEEKMLLY